VTAAAALVGVGNGVLVSTSSGGRLVDPPAQAADAATLIATMAVVRHWWRFI
jgi:hypothetical protein